MDSKHPLYRALAKGCSRCPCMLWAAAYLLPGIALGTSFAFWTSNSMSLRFVGKYLAPGWMLGGPLCATLAVRFTLPEESVRTRIGLWCSTSFLSLVFAPFVAVFLALFLVTVSR